MERQLHFYIKTWPSQPARNLVTHSTRPGSKFKLCHLFSVNRYSHASKLQQFQFYWHAAGRESGYYWRKKGRPLLAMQGALYMSIRQGIDKVIKPWFTLSGHRGSVVAAYTRQILGLRL